MRVPVVLGCKHQNIDRSGFSSTPKNHIFQVGKGILHFILGAWVFFSMIIICCVHISTHFRPLVMMSRYQYQDFTVLFSPKVAQVTHSYGLFLTIHTQKILGWPTLWWQKVWNISMRQVETEPWMAPPVRHDLWRHWFLSFTMSQWNV